MTSGCETPESLPGVTGSCQLGLGPGLSMGLDPGAQDGTAEAREALLSGSHLAPRVRVVYLCRCVAQPWRSGCGSPGHRIFLQFVPSITEGKPVRWGQELTSCV